MVVGPERGGDLLLVFQHWQPRGRIAVQSDQPDVIALGRGILVCKRSPNALTPLGGK